MESFIARYASPHLVGIDFDIEGGQSQTDIQNLVAAAAGAQSQYPNLQFSFTLATLGASDGSYGGVNALGSQVVQAVLGSSLKNYVINLMTMDFGSASSSVCVVVSGSCEMAQSAIQAVKNLEHTYAIPAGKIAVTPMIGLNDNTSETFTAADADTLTSYATSNGLAGLHFWSLDRDTPCSSATTTPPPPATRSPARHHWSTPTGSSPTSGTDADPRAGRAGATLPGPLPSGPADSNSRTVLWMSARPVLKRLGARDIAAEQFFQLIG